MAKMRGIKPEAFTDDKMLRLSPLARWLFVGMWTLACDNGHVEDNAVQLKVRLLPVDNCNVGDLVSELLATGQVERHDGYLKVAKLAEHQRIDRRYLSLCEWCEHDVQRVFDPADKAPRTTGAQRAHDGHPSGARRVHDVEGEKKVRGEEGEGERASHATRTRRSPEKPLPEDWRPSTAHADYCREHGLDLSDECFRFRNHAIANDRRQRQWNAAFANWLAGSSRRAGERRETAQPSSAPKAMYASLAEYERAVAAGLT